MIRLHHLKLVKTSHSGKSSKYLIPTKQVHVTEQLWNCSMWARPKSACGVQFFAARSGVNHFCGHRCNEAAPVKGLSILPAQIPMTLRRTILFDTHMVASIWLLFLNRIMKVHHRVVFWMELAHLKNLKRAILGPKLSNILKRTPVWEPKFHKSVREESFLMGYLSLRCFSI